MVIMIADMNALMKKEAIHVNVEKATLVMEKKGKQVALQINQWLLRLQ